MFTESLKDLHKQTRKKLLTTVFIAKKPVEDALVAKAGECVKKKSKILTFSWLFLTFSGLTYSRRFR
jgi:hypothetical protein